MYSSAVYIYLIIHTFHCIIRVLAYSKLYFGFICVPDERHNSDLPACRWGLILIYMFLYLFTSVLVIVEEDPDEEK